MNKNKLILSISFCYHDSSITLADDKEILLHLEAERLYREKHKKFNNINEVDYTVSKALEAINKSIDDVTEVLVTEWENLYPSDYAIILGKKFKYELTNHHNNHIGAVLPSNYDKCVIYVSDGGSESGTTKVYYKDGKEIYLAENLDNSLYTGMFYGTMAQLLLEPDFDKAHTSAVGKFMGLSSCGRYDKMIESIIRDNINELNTLKLNGIDDLLPLFNLKNEFKEPWKNELKKDIAHTAHNLWVNENAKYLAKHNKFSRNICMTGGCALNISLNSKLIDDKIFDNVYTSPIATDAGQSLGAILFKYPEIKVNYPFVGRGINDYYSNIDYDEIVSNLLDHKIISWYQGKSEIGARALGHRSFIGLPDTEKMRKRLSEEIKKREPYRPVAAIVMESRVSDFFEQNYKSPYMTFCAKAKENTKNCAPAIVHYDGTTRVQTLEYKDNPILYKVLEKLEEKGVVPIIMNTSFNVMGEPIVDTIEDAIKTHKNSGADLLYIDGKKVIL